MVSSDSSADVLVGRLRNGEEQVLAELFSYYRHRLRRMVDFRLDGRLRGRVDPSDVLQEAYLAAAQRVEHFAKKPALPFFVWLREVTVQRLIDVHRRHLEAQKRDAGQEVSLRSLSHNTSISLAQQLVAHLNSPSEVMLRIERMEQLRDALESMEAIDREVLALRHFEELTNDETAEILNLKKAAASNRYVRALERLKQILQGVPGFFDDIEMD